MLFKSSWRSILPHDEHSRHQPWLLQAALYVHSYIPLYFNSYADISRRLHVRYVSPQVEGHLWTPAVGKLGWQKRRLSDHAPHWDPGGDHSPNSLLAAAFSQGGFALEIPSPDLYYKILPEHAVRKVDEHRGVKVRGLWYDGPALRPYRGERSSRGGQRQTAWIVHRDPRDRRTVFFQDPLTHQWHPLRWTGLPPDIEVARERAQARAAAADRPQLPARPAPADGRTPAGSDERRRRREAALDGPLEAPPRLGDEVRRRNLFVLPPAADSAEGEQ
ncbi:hypothetical protein ACIOGZ_29245 [Kitasatospora sp. NPDC088160]|uniref:hypothetical protein n=1 Tax=Kitasatospora sp. NPDC088160 TaxID=3364072 RepID=UPI0037FF5208